MAREAEIDYARSQLSQRRDWLEGRQRGLNKFYLPLIVAISCLGVGLSLFSAFRLPVWSTVAVSVIWAAALAIAVIGLLRERKKLRRMLDGMRSLYAALMALSDAEQAEYLLLFAKAMHAGMVVESLTLGEPTRLTMSVNGAVCEFVRKGDAFRCQMSEEYVVSLRLGQEESEKE